jgi:hypothetical protein
MFHHRDSLSSSMGSNATLHNVEVPCRHEPVPFSAGQKMLLQEFSVPLDFGGLEWIIRPGHQACLLALARSAVSTQRDVHLSGKRGKPLAKRGVQGCFQNRRDGTPSLLDSSIPPESADLSSRWRHRPTFSHHRTRSQEFHWPHTPVSIRSIAGLPVCLIKQ